LAPSSYIVTPGRQLIEKFTLFSEGTFQEKVAEFPDTTLVGDTVNDGCCGAGAEVGVGGGVGEATDRDAGVTFTWTVSEMDGPPIPDVGQEAS
jgi:hypothetical protein